MTISSKLESFERNVNTCDVQAIEGAADLGENSKDMNTGQAVTFRMLLNKYRNECYAVKVPASTKQRAESIMGEARKIIGTAESSAAPKIESIKARIEAARKSAIEIAKKTEKEIRAESERRAAIKRASK
jgi:hypothetical protein